MVTIPSDSSSTCLYPGFSSALRNANPTPTRLTTPAATSMNSAPWRVSSSSIADSRVSVASKRQTWVQTRSSTVAAATSHPTSTVICQGTNHATTRTAIAPALRAMKTRLRAD